MSLQTVDFLESFLADINFKTFVSSFSDDGTNTTITVGYMYYARAGLTIDIDGIDYNIISVDYDLKQIVVSGVIAAPNIAELQPVKYYHGTPLAVTAELNAIPMTSDKAPYLYVYEMIPEDYNHEVSNQLDRVASVRMVFLDDSSSYNTTDEHYSNVITPLNNLANKFIDEVIADKSNFVRSLIDNSRRLNHVLFGTYTDSKGHERKIFNDVLTGIELDIDLPFRRLQECNISTPEACPKAIIKALFEAGDDTMITLTIDSDNSGTYSSISDDGASGDITININGAGDVPFTNPALLAIGDTLVIKRTLTTSAGWVKLSV